jgi:hypothetical protein
MSEQQKKEYIRSKAIGRRNEAIRIRKTVSVVCSTEICSNRIIIEVRRYGIAGCDRFTRITVSNIGAFGRKAFWRRVND